jgi:O-Antigen ligase
MTTMNLEGTPTQIGIPSERFRDAMVWLMFAVSFVVFFEPAPVDLMFAVVVLTCLSNGLSRTIGAAPLAILLITYNVGGFMSFVPVMGAEKAGQFVIISTYMAVAGIFIAYYISYDPVRRFNVIKAGLIFGAFVAAIIGIMDFADILPSITHHSNLPGRATGMFKDPNVFSTYLILPAIVLIQGLMLGTTKRKLLSSLALLPILAALFLAFSRGAWINFMGAVVLMTVLSFIFSSKVSSRFQIIIFVCVAVLLATIAFSALMTIPAIREMFIQRFALIQNYDAGETGRFGNQANAVPMLLARPLGFGPLQFHAYFNLDPHNTFLNAFASYGWLGGIAYTLLVISTIIIGCKTICTKTPWQNQAIAVFCPLLTTFLQGVQIDTEHWRHLYWMLGLMWGLFAATLQPSATLQFAREMRLQRLQDA